MNRKSSMEGRPATGEGFVTPRHCWDSASCSWPLTTHCRVTLGKNKGTWVKPSQCPVSRESLSTASDAAKSSNGRCKLDYCENDDPILGKILFISSWRLFFSHSPWSWKTFVRFNLFLTWIQTMASQLSLQACPGASSGLLLEMSSFQQNNNAGQQVWMFACIYVRRGSCWKELQEMNFQDGVLLRGSVSWPAMRVQIFNSPASILERGFSMFPKWAICSLQIHALHNVDSNKTLWEFDLRDI